MLPVVTRVRRAKPPSPNEIDAADAVAAIRSGDLGTPMTWEHADTGAVDKMHDFWLVGDGIREALEVTAIADERTRTNLGHWHTHGPGASDTIAGLTSAWMIMVDPVANATALNRRLPEWLRTLEADGISETGRWDADRLYRYPVASAIVDAGVMIASTTMGPPAGTVSFFYTSTIPSRPYGDPNHIAAAVSETLAHRRHVADAEKLDASGASVRHLFLWVDSLTRLDIGRALTDGMPSAAPTVDPRITDVWLGLPDTAAATIASWSPAHGWRRPTTVAAPSSR